MGSPALVAWRAATEPELQQAIRAGVRGRSTPRQSELISAWVWARVTDYPWRTLEDLLSAHAESLVPDDDEP